MLAIFLALFTLLTSFVAVRGAPHASTVEDDYIVDLGYQLNRGQAVVVRRGPYHQLLAHELLPLTDLQDPCVLFLEQNTRHVQKYTLCRPAAWSLAFPSAHLASSQSYCGSECGRRHLPSSISKVVYYRRRNSFYPRRYSTCRSTHFRRLLIS